MATKEQEIIKRVRREGDFKFRAYSKFCRKVICPLIPQKIKIRKERVADYTYVSICRAKDFDMVLASLYGLYKNSKLIPSKIVLVSDGSWEPKVALDYFGKYNLPLSAICWEECAKYYANACPKLKIWAENHIWGKKMAAILYLSETQKVLFSDPDILWYGTPFTAEELNTMKYKVSVDNATSYDQDCIKALSLDVLNKREPVNCGAVFIDGGISILNKEALDCIDYEGEHYGPFAEQTVFAALDIKYNNRWKMTEITSQIDDMFNIFTLKNTIHYDGMIARHYLYFLKWIYWKEYIKMLIL